MFWNERWRAAYPRRVSQERTASEVSPSNVESNAWESTSQIRWWRAEKSGSRVVSRQAWGLGWWFPKGVR